MSEGSTVCYDCQRDSSGRCWRHLFPGARATPALPNVWTTYACGIHGREGDNRGQPCPHRCRAV